MTHVLVFTMQNGGGKTTAMPGTVAPS